MVDFRDRLPPLNELIQTWQSACEKAAGNLGAREELLQLLDDGLAWATIQTLFEKNVLNVDHIEKAMLAAELLDNVGQFQSTRPESLQHIIEADALASLLPYMNQLRGQEPVGNDLRLHQAVLSLINSLSAVEDGGQTALALSLGALPCCLRYTNAISSPKAQQVRGIR